MKNVTIYTLAEELNMTPAMVSRAFNANASVSQKKRKIILKTAEKYNFVPNKMASRLPMKEIVIGVIMYFRFEPCYSKLIAGIKAAHEELKDYKIKCDIRFLNKNEHEPEECCKVLKELAACDGIIVAGLTHPCHKKTLDEIYKKNKNIVTIHTDKPEEKVLFSSVIDIESSTRLAVEFLKNCLFFSPRKNVVLFMGDRTSSIHQNSKELFIKLCREEKLNVISIMIMEDSAERLNYLCETELKGCRNVDGIYITSGNSIELCKYIERKGFSDRIALVTFDTYSELNEYIEKGVVNATIEQNLFSQAKKAYESLAKYLYSGEPVKSVIKSPCELLMKSNLKYL